MYFKNNITKWKMMFVRDDIILSGLQWSIRHALLKLVTFYTPNMLVIESTGVIGKWICYLYYWVTFITLCIFEDGWVREWWLREIEEKYQRRQSPKSKGSKSLQGVVSYAGRVFVYSTFSISLLHSFILTTPFPHYYKQKFTFQIH